MASLSTANSWKASSTIAFDTYSNLLNCGSICNVKLFKLALAVSTSFSFAIPSSCKLLQWPPNVTIDKNPLPKSLKQPPSLAYYSIALNSAASLYSSAAISLYTVASKATLSVYILMICILNSLILSENLPKLLRESSVVLMSIVSASFHNAKVSSSS